MESTHGGNAAPSGIRVAPPHPNTPPPSDESGRTKGKIKINASTATRETKRSGSAASSLLDEGGQEDEWTDRQVAERRTQRRMREEAERGEEMPLADTRVPLEDVRNYPDE